MSIIKLLPELCSCEHRPPVRSQDSIFSVRHMLSKRGQKCLYRGETDPDCIRYIFVIINMFNYYVLISGKNVYNY